MLISIKGNIFILGTSTGNSRDSYRICLLVRLGHIIRISIRGSARRFGSRVLCGRYVQRQGRPYFLL